MRLQVLVDLADRISGPASNIVRTLGGLERAAVQTSSAIDRIQMGASLAAAALALAAPIGLATRAAIEFESAFADVKKVVEFTPALGPEVLQQQLIALSRQIPRSAAELTQIAAAAGQAGIALEELAGFTEDAAKVAVAFDISAQEAGDTLAKLRNIFGMTQPQVVQLADAVNHLSNNMAATAPQILEVLKRIGGTGQLVGLTAQQMAALGAAMLATGTRPEVVATGLQPSSTDWPTPPPGASSSRWASRPSATAPRAWRRPSARTPRGPSWTSCAPSTTPKTRSRS